MNSTARILALYLPQYHPIPENEIWWRKGFTEWTNVGKARRYFRGHYQPRVPADLGYYDLRVPETRQAQADMARDHSIEGFCYWHYWFGNGKRLLELPFNEVLKSGKPDFPFCLAWANESWKGFEYGASGRNLLIEQKYPGKQDIDAHFEEVLPALLDKRYITVDGKPLFMLFRPENLPDAPQFIERWQNLAIINGLKGIHFVGHTYCPWQKQLILDKGFDAVNIVRLLDCFKTESFQSKIYRKLFSRPNMVSYKKAINFLVDQDESEEYCYPTLIPNFDHTPRTGSKGFLLHHSTPSLFEVHVKEVLKVVENKKEEHKIIFLKSWNEWAEGNYIEPDLKFGLEYLQVIKRNLGKKAE
jgi:hypothetical protein